MKNLSRDVGHQEAATSVLGLDPGTDKCGVAVLASDRSVLYRKVVRRESLPATIVALQERFGIARVAIGDRTGSAGIARQLTEAGIELPIEQVSEAMTSLLARQRYWQDNPPRGLAWLIPLGLRIPPRPVDDYAAVIIAERLLEREAQEQ